MTGSGAVRGGEVSGRWKRRSWFQPPGRVSRLADRHASPRAVALAAVLAVGIGAALPAAAGCLDGVTVPIEASLEAEAAAPGTTATTLRSADGARLRLAGVAEPLAALGRQAAASDAVGAARAALARWLAAPGLAAAIGQAADRHGRWPARLSDGDGRDLATRLVEAGLAPARPTADAPGCAARLYPAEAAARAARRGIWADAAFWPLAARAEGDADSRRGAYVLIEARIHSIRRGDGVTFVNFGADFRRDFTALFPHKGRNRGAFVEPPHSRDIGREVRVRGVVGGANALSVRIESPEQWEWSGP